MLKRKEKEFSWSELAINGNPCLVDINNYAIKIPTKYLLASDRKGDEGEYLNIIRPEGKVQKGIMSLIFENETPLFMLGMGGSRGGGKSTLSVIIALWHALLYGPKANILMVRTSLDQHSELLNTITSVRGMKYFGEYKKSDNMFLFHNGARMKFTYLATEKDARQHQGMQYTLGVIDDAGTILDPGPLYTLTASFRSLELPELKPMIVMSYNPGHESEEWLIRDFIRGNPQGWIPYELYDYHGKGTGEYIMHVQLNYSDNPYSHNDPTYLNRIGALTPDKNLAEAWQHGTWGLGRKDSFFGDVWHPQENTVKPFHIDNDTGRFVLSMDHGRLRPTAIIWGCFLDRDIIVHKGTINERILNAGTYIIFREYYSCKPHKTNEGNGIGIKGLSGIILKWTKDMKLDLRNFVMYADPHIYSNIGTGTTVGDEFKKYGVYWDKAFNKRVNQKLGRVGAWDYISESFLSRKIVIFDNCFNLLLSIPRLKRDKHNWKDIDTDQPDHLIDALRYGFVRKYNLKEENNIVYPFQKESDVFYTNSNSLFNMGYNN